MCPLKATLDRSPGCDWAGLRDMTTIHIHTYIQFRVTNESKYDLIWVRFTPWKKLEWGGSVTSYHSSNAVMQLQITPTEDTCLGTAGHRILNTPLHFRCAA